MLGKIETLESGLIICVVDYKGARVVIPLKEMGITLKRPED